MYTPEKQTGLNAQRERQWSRAVYDAFGITIKDFVKMCKERGGKCDMCSDKTEINSLMIDLYPQTREIRGIVCMYCKSYIEKHEEFSLLLDKYLDNVGEQASLQE